VLQAAMEKKVAKFSADRTEKTNTIRQKAELDRLQFKMNHTMQLLKDEQKQQEGSHCSNVHIIVFSSFRCCRNACSVNGAMLYAN